MIRISDLNVPIGDTAPLAHLAARRLGLASEAVREVRVIRRAIDARRRGGAPLRFVYTLDVGIEGNESVALHSRTSRGRDAKITRAPKTAPSVLDSLPDVSALLGLRPVVVGFGPAGIFAALALARAGCRPIVLERGADVDSRAAAVEGFWSGGALDENTNVQFGEGGAGAFSDGKLTARGKDPLTGDVLTEFVRAGAPEEILWLAKPHIGTDILRDVVKNLRREITRLGGEVRFNAMLAALEYGDGGVRAAVLAGGERIAADAVFMGIGHSARDTYISLMDRGIRIVPKPFAIGVRIEHPQRLIDRAQYGEDAGDPRLPPADYALTFHDGDTGRGVYSFCMCPGGEVVAAASEAGGTAVNGMSRHSRASGVANSALAVEVRTADFGESVPGGIEFQRKYERLAFRLAGGDYRAPVETVGDFLNGFSGSRDFLVTPTYRPGVTPAGLDRCLPPFVTRALRNALQAFGRRIRGFDDMGAPLTGVETRTSAPCRIVRDAESRESVSAPGLYPIGEGAGYAGGIMSAAIDGIRSALAFLRKISHNCPM